MKQDLFIDKYQLPSLQKCLEEQAHLDYLKSSRSEEGGIRISGASCDLLDQQTQSLASWTKRLGGNSTKQAVCSCNGGECAVNVSDVVPDVVNEMEAVVPDYDGPNCWNAALVFARVVPYFRHSTEKEMKFWLGSPLCREISPSEDPRPGDIVEIRDSQGGEVHGFIYLTSDLGLSKDGQKASSPYYLQTLPEIFTSYDVPKSCRRVNGAAPRCSNYANYFSCESYRDYLKNFPEPLPDQFLNLEKQVTVLEKKVSQLALYGKHSSDPLGMRDLLLGEVTKLRSSVTPWARQKGSVATAVLWKGLLVRLEAFDQQLDEIK